MVSSARPRVFPSDSIALTISGRGMISSTGYEFLGFADGPRGTVPPTNGTNYKSDQVCIDADGWRHYYMTDGSGVNVANDVLLFSVEDYPEISNQLGLDVLSIAGNAGTSLISNTPENYVLLPEGWLTMNRFWDLELVEEQQPLEPVAIRFYYTEEDFQAMVNALPSDSILAHSDLSFYKINQTAQGYNTNPLDGHTDIPLAEYCADEGYWEYSFADQADTLNWSYGMHKDAHYAELLVHEFSGGGGGVGSAIDFSSQVDETYVDEKNWSVYPNPIGREVFVKSHNRERPPVLIQCFNMQGEMVYVESQRIDSDMLSLNTTAWPSGIYFVKIANEESIQIEMLVKP